MKLLTLLFSVVFLAAVNGKLADNKEQDKPPMVLMSATKPTPAPLITFETEPKKSSMIKGFVEATEKTAMEKNMKIEDLPIEMPATVDHKLKAEESSPLAVTAFITRDDNIYEIEDKNGHGMGKIQARQARDTEEHICNYGTVVIYSDVPCNQITNIQVSKFEDKPVTHKVSENREDLVEQKKPARRPTNIKRFNKNNKTKMKQQQQLQQQKLRKQNAQNVLKNIKKDNSNKNNRRLQQQLEHDNWEYVEDEEYNDGEDGDGDDDEVYQFENKRKGQLRQQQNKFYISEYDDDDY